MWEVFLNRHVLFGEGALSRVAEVMRGFAREHVFVLAYRADAASVWQAVEALEAEGLSALVDDSIKAEPKTADIDRIAGRIVEAECDAVLAIGGGSVLDTAKAAAMLATNGGCVEAYQMEGKPILTPALPWVAVPTTAGTGSEATKVSVVYNSKNRLKKSFYSPNMLASAVILDPMVTAGLSGAVTVSTGIDALSHAIESYVSLDATPFTEMYSLESMRRVLSGLSRCVERPDDLKARGDMLLASYLGGVAINAGIGLAHMIAQPLGGLLGIPHGVACAVYLPHALAYNADAAMAKICTIARLFGAEGEDSQALAAEGIDRVKRYLASLHAPDSIRGYLPADFDLNDMTDRVVAATGHIRCNPRPVTPDAIRDVIQKTL